MAQRALWEVAPSGARKTLYVRGPKKQTKLTATLGSFVWAPSCISFYIWDLIFEFGTFGL